MKLLALPCPFAYALRAKAATGVKTKPTQRPFMPRSCFAGRDIAAPASRLAGRCLCTSRANAPGGKRFAQKSVLTAGEKHPGLQRRLTDSRDVHPHWKALRAWGERAAHDSFQPGKSIPACSAC